MKWALFLLALPLAGQNALYVDLSGPWRLLEGDSLAYAARDFDDRQWATVTVPLSSPPRGQFWMRRRVDLPPGTDRSRMALTLGAVAHVYEVYVNGERIGATDGFDQWENAHLMQSHTLAIPAGVLTRGPEIAMQIAVRARRLSAPLGWVIPDRGPYALSYQGQLPLIGAVEQFDRQLVENSPLLVFGTILWSIALVSLLAWANDRGRVELLWFALFSLVTGWQNLVLYLGLDAQARPFTQTGITLHELIAVSLSCLLELDAAGRVCDGFGVASALRRGPRISSQSVWDVECSSSGRKSRAWRG